MKEMIKVEKDKYLEMMSEINYFGKELSKDDLDDPEEWFMSMTDFFLKYSEK